LVVFLADDFLVVDFFAAFLAMALSPPFCAQTVMLLKIRVNGFLRCAHFFLRWRARPFGRRSRADVNHQEHEGTKADTKKFTKGFSLRAFLCALRVFVVHLLLMQSRGA
jgi:hypothetical protein